MHLLFMSFFSSLHFHDLTWFSILSPPIVLIFVVSLISFVCPAFLSIPISWTTDVDDEFLKRFELFTSTWTSLLVPALSRTVVLQVHFYSQLLLEQHWSEREGARFTSRWTIALYSHIVVSFVKNRVHIARPLPPPAFSSAQLFPILCFRRSQ